MHRVHNLAELLSNILRVLKEERTSGCIFQTAATATTVLIIVAVVGVKIPGGTCILLLNYLK